MDDPAVETKVVKPGLMVSIPFWCALSSVLILLLLLRDLLLNPADISSWLAMRICGVNLMMDEMRPYLDFWDWTLPTVYDFFKMPCVLRLWMEKVGLYVPINVFITVFVWVLTLVSALATSLVVKRVLDPADRVAGAEVESESEVSEQRSVSQISMEALVELKAMALPFVSALALASMIVRFDLGDLQHLYGLALFPYVLVRWLACRHLGPGLWLRFVIGALTGITACFDVPFALVFAVLEVYFVLQHRSIKVLASPEVLAFVLSAGVCLVRMSQLEEPVSTAFWKWTLPMRLLNYHVWNDALFASLASPDRRDVCYAMALTLALVFVLKHKSTIIFPLTIIMLVGFGLFILEGEGYSHDLILTIMASCLILSILLTAELKNLAALIISRGEQASFANLRYPVVVAGFLVAALACGFSLQRDRDKLKDYQAQQAKGSMNDTMTAINKYSAWKEKVLVLADVPGPAYPALLVLDRPPGGYLLWSRPLRLFEFMKKCGMLTGPMRDFYLHTYSKLRSDIRSPDVKLVLVHNYYAKEILAREGMLPMFDVGYVVVPDCINYSAGNWQPREFVGLDWALNVYQRPDSDAVK